MMDRPRIICLMSSSLDGGLHPGRWTHSPDGTAEQWSRAYEALHDELAADAWLVGRATMAEMAKGEPHPPATVVTTPPRPIHLVDRRGPFAIAIDRSGKLHFAASEVGGDPVIVLLGRDVADAHLAELVADDISYIIAGDEQMALPPLMVALRRERRIETLLLEGGGIANGSFLAAGLVDELYVLLAPALAGSSGGSIVEMGSAGLEGMPTLSLQSCDRLDGGLVRLHYVVAPDRTP